MSLVQGASAQGRWGEEIFLTSKDIHGKIPNDLRKYFMIKQAKPKKRPSILVNRDRGSFFMGI
jgi:hypothetical protein